MKLFSSNSKTLVSKKTLSSQELEKLANQVIGSVDLQKHPEWSTVPKINHWVRKIRQEWDVR
jgi:hypothetical protein